MINHGTAMISNIRPNGGQAVDFAAVRQSRAKKTDAAPENSVENAKADKPEHRAHPHGHVPPGLARAAEKIASKIFSRADADGSGTVTQEELSAVHSKHARMLSSSDLFSKTSTEAPGSETTGTETNVGTETVDSTTGVTTDGSGEAGESGTETPTEVGVTQEQLKETLTKFFYAKVGVTYAPPAPPAPTTTEPTDSGAPSESTTISTPPKTTPPVVDLTLDGAALMQTFVAVA